MKKLFLVACLLALVAGPASADTIIGYNANRPVTIQPAYPGEMSLQQIVDSMFGAGLVNVNTDQDHGGMFAVSANPPTITPSLAFEFTAGADTQEFGFWSATDTGAVTSHAIFKGPADGTIGSTWGASAGIKWLTPTSGLVFGVPDDCTGGLVDCTAFSGINMNWFGFYLQIGGGTKYFTVDQLNGEQARSLIFRKPGSDTYAIAFEDGGDWDYQDGVLKIESVNAVPEPGSMLLLGSGLIGLVGAARRRFGKQ